MPIVLGPATEQVWLVAGQVARTSFSILFTYEIDHRLFSART
jgi:hypothetical protein